MSEYITIWQIATAFVCTGLAAVLYSMGGRAIKALRRFLAPAIITGGLVGISLWSEKFSYYLLAAYPILVLSWVMGYGSDNNWIKIGKRTLVGLVILALSGLLAWNYSNFGVFAIHSVLVGCTVFIGVRSFISAAAEEFIICSLQVFPLFWYLFR